MTAMTRDSGDHGDLKFSLGLALSGGGFRGMAHIGVIRTLENYGLLPDFVAGTSAGSLIGALCASGKNSREIEAIACKVFWPGMLRSQGIRNFCERYLPCRFEGLALPLRVAVTELPSWKTRVLESGDLASALAASCATPYLLHRVRIGKASYTDGGWGCILPATICRNNACRIVVGSDVWFRSAFAKHSGLSPASKLARAIYSRHYLEASRQCDVVIQPCISASSIIPNCASIRRMIHSGERAARASLANCVELAV